MPKATAHQIWSTVTESVLIGLAVFALVFIGLRAVEWLYHSARRTPDWSPHWGSWLFAVLSGIYALINNLGR